MGVGALSDTITAALILGLVLCSSASSEARELEVVPGDETGLYFVSLGGGRTVMLQLATEGPEAPEAKGIDNCEFGGGHSLLVSMSEPSIATTSLSVPLEAPSRIGSVLAVEQAGAILIALTLNYQCSHWRGETVEDRWIAIEFDSEPRLLLNASISEGGFRCFPGDLRQPKLRLEPEWAVTNGELWMKLGVRTWLCYSSAGEERGRFEWRVGEQPTLVEFPFTNRHQHLIHDLQLLGSQPYVAFSIGRRFAGLLAEYPMSMSGPRLLAIADRKGRTGMIHLPQLGFHPDSGLAGIPVDRPIDNEQTSDNGSRWPNKDWPQLGAVEAFRFSGEFLRARPAPIVSEILQNRSTTVFELGLPCVEATNPAPAGAEIERWLVRVERAGDSLTTEAALIESCSLGWYGVEANLYRLPPASISEGRKRIKISYPLPEIDLVALSDDKFLFMNYWGLVERFRVSSLEMSLDSPTKVSPRCSPSLPSEGKGWLTTKKLGCRLDVRFWGGGWWTYPKGATAARFVDTPSIASWCGAAEEMPEWLSLKAEVREDGSIHGLKRSYPSGGYVPPEIASDIEQWRISPGTDVDGNAMRDSMAFEVGRGLPTSPSPDSCE